MNLDQETTPTDSLEVNVKDKNGCTPLHWAVYAGSQTCLGYLISIKGVDLDAKDNWG